MKVHWKLQFFANPQINHDEVLGDFVFKKNGSVVSHLFKIDLPEYSPCRSKENCYLVSPPVARSSAMIKELFLIKSIHNHIYEPIHLKLLNPPEIINKDELSKVGVTLRNSVRNSLMMPFNIYEENDSFVEADMFWKSGFNGKTKKFRQDLLEVASWLEKSQSENDPVNQFILLYIAFNGLYSHFSRSVTKTKKDDPKSEFNKILKELLGEEEAGKIVTTYRQQLNALIAFNLVSTGKKSEQLSKMLDNIMQKKTVNNLCVVFAATRCIHQIRIELFHYGTHMPQRRQKVKVASQILLGIIARCMKHYVTY